MITTCSILVTTTGNKSCKHILISAWRQPRYNLFADCNNLRVLTCVNRFIPGKPFGLYELYLGEHVSVLQGCGLGGGSLINASVGLDAEPAVYQKPDWPAAFMSDVENMLKTDRRHVTDMLMPTPYPDSYTHPPLAKTERMREGFAAFDIEDLHKHFYKAPLYVTFEDKERNHVGVPQPRCTACGNCCGGCNVGAKNTLNMNYIAQAKAYGAEIYTKVHYRLYSKSSLTLKEWRLNLSFPCRIRLVRTTLSQVW